MAGALRRTRKPEAQLAGEEAGVDAVEALCDSEQWGHVADGQKLVAVSWLAAREQQQATATVVGGDYAMHALIVRAELDAQSLSVAGRDLSGYEAWMRAAADFPVLLPVAAEQHLERLLSSLECLVGQGAWSHEQFEQLLPLLAVDLSGDTDCRMQRLLAQMDEGGSAEAKSDAHALRCALVHRGSIDSRKAWKEFLFS